MAIDSHMHISKFLNNPYQLIKDINSNFKIEAVINVGLDISFSAESLTYLDNDKVYSSIGIHPLYISKSDPERLYYLVHEKVVAIGEIGLDSLNSDYENQKKYLIEQLVIANELKLPVIIHSNNANTEIIRIFKTIVKPKYGCVFHCFQPDVKSLKYLINEGFYISFAGRITYKNASKSLQIASLVPNDLFLVETDSPYISPEPLRDTINVSSNIKYIIQKLSEIKQLSYEEIERITVDNTKRLFFKLR